MNAYQWISGIVFPGTRLTVPNGQVSKARRTVNCCRLPKAAEPEAKSTGRNIRDGAVSFGHSVKNFFTRLFGS